METVFSILVGIGLSAACGFRVFVPFLVMSVASSAGHLELSPEFQWIGSLPALIAFGTATILEVAAYYMPWVDHTLDVVATPVAIVAGTIITASLQLDMSPFMKWTLAVIAGGGAAALVQATTVTTRAVSLFSSGGITNPIVSTSELGGSLVSSLLAIIAPVAACVLITGILGFVAVKIHAHRTAASPSSPPEPCPR